MRKLINNFLHEIIVVPALARVAGIPHAKGNTRVWFIHEGVLTLSLKIGVQLFSVRDYTEKSMEDALKKVAEFGYDGVEFAGYAGLSAEKMKSVLDSLGLTAAGSHVGYGDFLRDTEGVMNYADTLGMKNVTIPVFTPEELLHEDTFENFRRFIVAAKKHGITFSYHNHNGEFKKADGAYILDKLYETIPELHAELDTYWASDAGVEPKAYMKKLGNRLSLIHIKEKSTDPKNPSANPPIGEGTMDNAGILKTAEEMGLTWAFVELDNPMGDSMQAIKKSREYLKSIGY